MIDIYIGRGTLDLPLLIDTIGTVDSTFTLINLDEWFAKGGTSNRESYDFIDGACPALPGYFVATDSIQFDSLAGPDENPFIGTPFTGSLQQGGTSGLMSNYSPCGDDNFDETVNVSDAVHIINYVFIGGDPPEPPEAGDCNCDGTCNVSDAVMIINYVFIGGNMPCDTNGDGEPDC